MSNAVGSHVEGNTQLNDRIRALEKEVEDVKEREMTACLLLQEAEKGSENLKEKLNMKDGDWEARLQDAEEKLVVWKEEVGKMKRDCCSLAEKNEQLCEINSRLEASVKNAQEERLAMKESLGMHRGTYLNSPTYLCTDVEGDVYTYVALLLYCTRCTHLLYCTALYPLWCSIMYTPDVLYCIVPIVV